MRKNWTLLALRLSITGAIVLLAAVTLIQYTAGYAQTLNTIAKITNSTGNEKKLGELLTEEKINKLRLLCLVIIIGLIVALPKLESIARNTSKFIVELTHSSAIRIKDFLDDSIALLALLIPLIVSLYHIANFPITNDEAATYLNYSSKSALASLAYYSHNNHILNSLFTNFSQLLPIPKIISIRLPSLCAFAATTIALYSMSKEQLGRETARFVAAIYSTLYFSLYYSFTARGYSLLTLFFILSLYSGLKIVVASDNRKHWLYFSIFSSLGIFTIPSFIYPYAAISLWLAIRRKTILEQLGFAILTALITLILYTPMLLISGLHSVIPSKLPADAIEARLPNFVFNAFGDMTGVSAWFVITIAAIGYKLLYKERNINELFLLHLITLVLLLYLQKVIPFSRTIIYFNIFISLYFGILLDKIRSMSIPQCDHAWILLPIILFQLAFSLNFVQVIASKEALSIAAAKDIPRIPVGVKCLIVSRTMDNYMLYYNTGTKNPKPDYLSPRQFGLDEDSNKHHCIVIDKEFSRSIDPPATIENEFYSIYLRHPN